MRRGPATMAVRPLLALLACAAALPARAEREISNFRSGLACTGTKVTEDGAGWICHETEDIFVTDQGVCVFNGKERPCTWIGFEFDYRGADKGTKLECISGTTVPVDAGNPNELIATEATSQPYELALEAGSGHFYNPQYFTFNVRPKGQETFVNTGSCKAAGKVLFEYRFKLHFPAMPGE